MGSIASNMSHLSDNFCLLFKKYESTKGNDLESLEELYTPQWINLVLLIWNGHGSLDLST